MSAGADHMVMTLCLCSRIIIKVPPLLNELKMILRLLIMWNNFSICKSMKGPWLAIAYKVDDFHFILEMFECW